MTNMILAYPDRTLEATITGGSYEADLDPADQLKVQSPKAIARSTDATLASTKLRLQYTQPRTISVVALANFNFSDTATMRITAYSDALITQTFRSEWLPIIKAVFTSEELGWSAPNFWTGKVSAEDREFFPSFAIETFTPVLTTYLEIEFDDTVNADGRIDYGRVFTGQAWSPVYNPAYGLQVVNRSQSRASITIGGSRTVDEQPRYRQTSFQLPALSEAEGARLLDIQRAAGIHGDVLFSIDPDDQQQKVRQSFIGNFEQPNPLIFSSPELFSMNLNLQEVL